MRNRPPTGWLGRSAPVGRATRQCVQKTIGLGTPASPPWRRAAPPATASQNPRCSGRRLAEPRAVRRGRRSGGGVSRDHLVVRVVPGFGLRGAAMGQGDRRTRRLLRLGERIPGRLPDARSRVVVRRALLRNPWRCRRLGRSRLAGAEIPSDQRQLARQLAPSLAMRSHGRLEWSRYTAVPGPGSGGPRGCGAGGALSALCSSACMR